MQTVYYATSNYIRHTGNVVDLMEYRRKLERAAALPEPESSDEARPAVKRHRRSWRNPGLALDFCASAAIVVLTVTVMIQFLVF